MKIPSAIFRAYDIRGLYPEQLNKETAHSIGRGMASFLIQKRGIRIPQIIVGRDNRTHSLELQQAFMAGLLESGSDVMDLGLSPSPFLYFATTVGNFDAGCNITASHNPPQYNGFKLVSQKAHAIYGEDLKAIGERISREEFTTGKGKKLASAKFFERYLDKIKTLFPLPQGRKIVIDTGNGVAGALYPQILSALGNTVIPLFTELDGNFPNHAPDPIVEKNLTHLKKTVIDNEADMGIAFDGDGDRLGIVDEKGNHWNADRLGMLYTQDVLRRFPGSDLVFTVSNSKTLFDMAEEWGGKPHLCPVGHSYVEKAMAEHNAIFGGEQSGHFFCAEDYYSYDDALVAAGRLIQIQKEAKQPLSKLFRSFPKTYSIEELRPHCADEQKFRVNETIKNHFLTRYPKSSTLDGIRIDFGIKGAWAGIRISNTSPCLSICLEAEQESDLQTIQKIVMEHLKSYPEIDFH